MIETLQLSLQVLLVVGCIVALIWLGLFVIVIDWSAGVVYKTIFRIITWSLVAVIVLTALVSSIIDVW